MAAQATSLGWNLVVPIVGGVLLGHYLDEKFDKEFTWTLSLLIAGVAVAFNNLYAMYAEHGEAENPTHKQKQAETEESQNDAKNP
jgi:predicted F0F1-ATPase subunit